MAMPRQRILANGRGRRALLPVLVLSLLGACSEPDGSAAAQHPWYRAPHNLGEDVIRIVPWMVHPVRAEVLDEARAELAEVSYVQVSPGMASHYAGQEVRVPAEARPFLVRALDAGGSEIEVLQSASSLWVRAVGGEGGPIVEQPIVVLLDPTPVGIFVTVEPGE